MMYRTIKPCRAYPEDVASKICYIIDLAKVMAERHYPHLLEEIEFCKRRMSEEEILFDIDKSDLKNDVQNS